MKASDTPQIADGVHLMKCLAVKMKRGGVFLFRGDWPGD
jgi:hypothetical protein